MPAARVPTSTPSTAPAAPIPLRRPLRPLPPDFAPLTETQLAVLQLLAYGYWPSRLAALLELPETAVTAAIGQAAEALGARTVEHAVVEALRRGLVV